MHMKNQLYPLKLENAFCIASQIKTDSRGSMSRLWDSQELLKEFKLNQSSFVTNPSAATLRGMHFQEEPFAENKLIHCVSGLIFDVVIDLRKTSKTYLQHETIEIGPESAYQGLFIPKGCAHGYLTAKANSNLVYFMDKSYSDKSARGLLWNDPQFNIKWPFKPVHISERDKNWPNFKS